MGTCTACRFADVHFAHIACQPVCRYLSTSLTVCWVLAHRGLQRFSTSVTQTGGAQLTRRAALQFKRCEGDVEAVVSRPLQRLTDIEALKHNTMLSGLFDLAAHLLSQKQDAQLGKP